jgi:hypothetical protein
LVIRFVGTLSVITIVTHALAITGTGTGATTTIATGAIAGAVWRGSIEEILAGITPDCDRAMNVGDAGSWKVNLSEMCRSGLGGNFAPVRKSAQGQWPAEIGLAVPTGLSDGPELVTVIPAYRSIENWDALAFGMGVSSGLRFRSQRAAPPQWKRVPPEYWPGHHVPFVASTQPAMSAAMLIAMLIAT